MSKKKEPAEGTAEKQLAEGDTPAAWNGESVHEVRCYKCNGMVNANGCAMDGCPVAAKRSSK